MSILLDGRCQSFDITVAKEEVRLTKIPNDKANHNPFRGMKDMKRVLQDTKEYIINKREGK